MKLKLKYPIAPWVVSQGFGGNDVPLYKQLGLLGHSGIDVPCKEGTPVYASHDGVVTYAGEDGAGGLTIVIRTKEKFEYGNDEVFFKSIYCHLKKGSFKIKATDEVKCGDQIAEADTTGYATASHLHFAIKPIAKGEADWQWDNIEQKNGYNGAINPEPYFTGEYAKTNPSLRFSSTLHFGQTSPDVARLQTLLKTLGYFPNEQPITNYYGNITRRAVLAFQFQNKVASFSELYSLQGSLCGPKTIAKLNTM